MLTPEAVMAVLARVSYPGFHRDIVSTGTVTKVDVDGGLVTVRLKLDGDRATAESLRGGIREAVLAMDGAQDVRIVLSSSEPVKLPVAGQPQQEKAPAPAPSGPDAGNIIGVASGKGGVGKSTVAVNLAVSLARAGRRVGFLDADVHGPSAPLMFGLEGRRPEQADEQGRPRPLEAFGVRIMSMGFFVERDNAVIWRGPIVGNFIKQLLTEVAWGELDDLVIDFPPGTGDAQLTISQTISMNGAVIVTTPNDLALVDALKAITMFRKVEIPILGLVENMAYFVCPHCGERTEIFGEGGAESVSRDKDVPLLGQVPIDPMVVRESDMGRPVVVERPDCPAAQAYEAIAQRVIESSNRQEGGSGGPGEFLERFGKKE